MSAVASGAIIASVRSDLLNCIYLLSTRATSCCCNPDGLIARVGGVADVTVFLRLPRLRYSG